MDGGIEGLRKFIYPHDLARFDAEIDAATFTREPLDLQFRATRGDGVEIFLHVDAESVHQHVLSQTKELASW